MPSYSGVWTLSAAYQAVAAGNWSNFLQGNIGLFGGGYVGAAQVNTITYITFAATGNATDFGDLTINRAYLGACGSSTRGLFAGGFTGPGTRWNVIDYVTFVSPGNATDFGDTTVARQGVAACNSSVRGVFGGGYTGAVVLNVVDYVTIASVGNATNFGDLTVERTQDASCSSPTRGIFAGGYKPGVTYYNVIDYVTIATTGNAVDFGDTVSTGGLTTIREMAGFSSSTRGVFAGGNYNPDEGGAKTNTIQYITIATTGNALDFGDLASAIHGAAACSNNTLGVIGGGDEDTSYINVLQYVTIATTGNTTDFGDLTASTSGLAGCSNSNGGLQ